MSYKIVSYEPSKQKKEPGIATIQVDGCALVTSLDIPYGAKPGDDKWNAAVDPVVASVLDGMDPDSDNYDPTLIAQD